MFWKFTKRVPSVWKRGNICQNSFVCCLLYVLAHALLHWSSMISPANGENKGKYKGNTTNTHVSNRLCPDASKCLPFTLYVCMYVCILNWPLPFGDFQDQYKQTTINKYSNKHNYVKNPNLQEADQLAIYKRSREVELGATENNISRELNPRPTYFKSGALTTRPRCLHNDRKSNGEWSYHVNWGGGGGGEGERGENVVVDSTTP